DPDSFDALLVRAQLRHRDGRPEPALADLERAVRVKPDDLGALQLLLQVQARLGLTDQAAATRARLRRARAAADLGQRVTREITKKPDAPEVRWRMGRVAAEGGMYTLAAQCFRTALDLDPGYQPARAALAALKADGHLPDAPAARGNARPGP